MRNHLNPNLEAITRHLGRDVTEQAFALTIVVASLVTGEPTWTSGLFGIALAGMGVLVHFAATRRWFERATGLLELFWFVKLGPLASRFLILLGFCVAARKMWFAVLLMIGCAWMARWHRLPTRSIRGMTP